MLSFKILSNKCLPLIYHQITSDPEVELLMFQLLEHLPNLIFFIYIFALISLLSQ